MPGIGARIGEDNMTTKTPGKRVDAIDFWRGFALLTIFIDHVPDNAFQQVTIRNFGLSDAAELFVFLSGASVALAYGPRFFNGETWAAVRAVFRRAFTLYWAQVLTSLLIIGLAGYVALVALMYFAQRALMYFPDTARISPAAAGLPGADAFLLDTRTAKNWSSGMCRPARSGWWCFICTAMAAI